MARRSLRTSCWVDRTPLSRAAEEEHAAVAALLFENKADIEVKGDNDRTPLLSAVARQPETKAQEPVAIVKLLLENGALTLTLIN